MATTKVKVNWPEAMLPLIKKYGHHKHPLKHSNLYQLLVMVVLSAQSTDDVVNMIAPALFAAYPDLTSLARATPQELFTYISKIRNFGHKANWLVSIAQTLGSDNAIPLTQTGLTALSGIGRKSANVIMREAGVPPEGIIVDLHVVRVAPRLGIVSEEDPKKMEEKLMKKLPRDEWEAGMSMSFLGREICRPEPLCEQCLMNVVCAYYAKLSKEPKKPVKKSKGAAKKRGRALK